MPVRPHHVFTSHTDGCHDAPGPSVGSSASSMPAGGFRRDLLVEGSIRMPLSCDQEVVRARSSSLGLPRRCATPPAPQAAGGARVSLKMLCSQVLEGVPTDAARQRAWHGYTLLPNDYVVRAGPRRRSQHNRSLGAWSCGRLAQSAASQLKVTPGRPPGRHPLKRTSASLTRNPSGCYHPACVWPPAAAT